MRALATTIFTIVIVLALLSEQAFVGDPQEHSGSLPVIAPSALYTDLNQRAEKLPRPSSEELAAIANTLLREKGLNYYFDACEIIKLNKHPKPLLKFSPHTKLYRHPLTLSSGKPINFEIISEDVGGPCSYCYFAFPSWQVTRKEIVLVAEGRKYRIKRPATFSLDQDVGGAERDHTGRSL